MRSFNRKEFKIDESEIKDIVARLIANKCKIPTSKYSIGSRYIPDPKFEYLQVQSLYESPNSKIKLIKRTEK